MIEGIIYKAFEETLEMWRVVEKVMIIYKVLVKVLEM